MQIRNKIWVDEMKNQKIMLQKKLLGWGDIYTMECEKQLEDVLKQLLK